MQRIEMGEKVDRSLSIPERVNAFIPLGTRKDIAAGRCRDLNDGELRWMATEWMHQFNPLPFARSFAAIDEGWRRYDELRAAARKYD